MPRTEKILNTGLMITSCVPTVEQDSEEDVNHCYHCDIRNRYRPMRQEDITSSLLMPPSSFLTAIINEKFSM